MTGRRRLLLGAGALASSALLGAQRGLATTPSSDVLTAHDLTLPGDPKLARRSLVLVPNPTPTRPVPVLVLLHGLGETGNELLGVHAWGDKYGLVTSYERLKRLPIERTLPRARYLTDEHLTRLNTSLATRPFSDLILVCPVTPNPYRMQPSHLTLDRYAAWIEETLLPSVRERFPATQSALHTGLDGCSLGGYVGMEVMLRRPHLFGSFGGVQSAFGVPQGQLYARRLATRIDQVGPRALHFETSTEDPYLAANRALSSELRRLKVPHTLTVLPGPHNQPWLREIGTLELVRWHAEQLALS